LVVSVGGGVGGWYTRCAVEEGKTNRPTHTWGDLCCRLFLPA
jgi:hypothetical protein